MKKLYIILFSLALFSTANTQSEWQEFLSHERSIISSNGHLLINDTIHVAYNDGIKKITGNHKPENLLPHYPYMYQRIKKTRTGINSNELLLLEAFDYDISGLGLVSFRNNNGQFWGKEQFGYEDFDTDFQYVPDGIVSPSSSILDQAIDHHGDLVKLNNGILETTSPSPIDEFHEGLEDNFYAIIKDSLYRYSDVSLSPVLHIGDYNNLLNDPYNNSLVIENENSLSWYSYDDFSLTSSKVIAPNTIAIQFIEDGFYQLTKNETEYVIYKYPFTETPAFETIFTLPFADEESFNILSFEISAQDLYLVGVNNANGFINGISFNYVQKRTIGEPFNPNRQDLAIESLSMTELGDDYPQASYTLTVRNNGTEDINAFSISSPTLPVFDQNYSFIRQHFDTNIAAGETFTFTDSIYMPTIPSQISVKITGVNYGYDRNSDNDEFTADVISLSTSSITKPNLDIYPNPSSDILTIKGEFDSQSTMNIYDANGQMMNYDHLTNDKLDISKLPFGSYILFIKSTSGYQSIPFTKI